MCYLGKTEKLRRFRTPALLLVTLVAGAILGICFEQNVGISRSDRLERRIGTENARVVSCVRSGSALTLTLDLRNAPQGHKSDSADSSSMMFRQGLDVANYGTIIGAVQEELTSNPLERGVDSITVVCRYQGKTAVTLTGDRAPDVTTIDSSGKKVLPAPFSSFEARYANGSTSGFVTMTRNDSLSPSAP